MSTGSTPDRTPGTPPGGRRRADVAPTSTATGRSPLLLVVLVVLVVVTGAALWFGGRAGTVAAPGGGESLVEPDQQQVVCPAGRGATTSRVGLLRAAGEGGRITSNGQQVDVPSGGVVSRRVAAREPDVVTATGAATRGLFATRVQGSGGLAGCASPRASWWYAGAGGAPSHASVLRLSNPGTGPAVLDVEVWGQDGEVPAPQLRGVSLKPGDSVRLPLEDLAPSPGTLALHVDVTRGLVASSLSDTVTPLVAGAGRGAEDDVPAARGPSRRLVISGLVEPDGGAVTGSQLPPTLADGASAVLVNPGERSVTARLRLSGEDGLSQPSGLSQTTVPPQSTVTVPLTSTVRGPGSALVVEADGPLVGGYQAPGARDLVHGVSGSGWEGPAAAALPADGRARVQLTARSRTAAATLTAYDERGRQVGRRALDVAARTTVSTRLPARAASVVVESDGGVSGAVEVQRSSGSSVLPLVPLLDALRVPDVRPG